MNELTVLHTADWHLEERNAEEVGEALSVICAHAESHPPVLIVVAGDLTHSQSLRFDTVAARTSVAMVTRLAMVAPVVICVGTPSHDGMAPMVHETIEARHPVLVADRPIAVIFTGGALMPVDIEAVLKRSYRPTYRDIEGFISIVPAPTKQHFRCSESSINEADKIIANALGGLFLGFAATRACLCPNAPHIHVGHCQVDGCSISETQTLTGVDISISPAQMRSLDADLIALGHIHKSQRIAQNFPAFYSGSPTSLNFGELDEKGFYMHTVGPNPESLFVSTNARRRRIRTFVFLETPPTEAALKAAFTPEEIAGAHLRIRAILWSDESRMINQSAIESWFMDAGAHSFKFELHRKPRKTVRAQHILEIPSLPEKLSEMATIRGHEPPGEALLEKAIMVEATATDELLKILRGDLRWN